MEMRLAGVTVSENRSRITATGSKGESVAIDVSPLELEQFAAILAMALVSMRQEDARGPVLSATHDLERMPLARIPEMLWGVTTAQPPALPVALSVGEGLLRVGFQMSLATAWQSALDLLDVIHGLSSEAPTHSGKG